MDFRPLALPSTTHTRNNATTLVPLLSLNISSRSEPSLQRFQHADLHYAIKNFRYLSLEYIYFALHKSINLLQFSSHLVASFSALHLDRHCKLYAEHPTALPAGPDAAGAASLAAQPQHFFGVSGAFSAQAQQSVFGGCGWQCGDFSQTRAQRGFWQSAGRWHFQSHNGSSHTLSHFGDGLVHSVWHWGSLHTVSHFGHAPFSQCLTGQRTSHWGLSHLMAHFEQPSSWQRVEQRGCSQIGSQTWLQTGESHFHWHLGWQSPPSPHSPVGESQAAMAVARIAKNTTAVFILKMN